MRRIRPRPSRVGTGQGSDEAAIEELEALREKHDRLTRGPPKKPFSQVLKEKMGHEEEEQAPEPHPPGAIEPHLGLGLNQDASLASQPGARSAKVIVKG